MVGRPILPTLVVFEVQQETCEYPGLIFFPSSSLLVAIFVLSVFFPLHSHIFFFLLLSLPPRPLTFICVSSNCRYVISFTWSFFRSLCLRISVFHNSLSLTLPTSLLLSSSLGLNHGLLLYYGTGPFLFSLFSLSLYFSHAYIPPPNLRNVRFACHSYRLAEQQSKEATRKHICSASKR